MKIMGIDASTTATGWSIFDKQKLIAYGVIKPKGEDWRERIMNESLVIKEIFEKYNPDKIYMEDVPMKKGASTLMKLGAVQGCVLSIAATYQIQIDFLLPSQWRSSLNLYDGTREGTHREVLKKKAIEVANEVFGLKLEWHGATSKKTQDDIAEAILIAYSQSKQRRFGSPKSQ